MFRVRFYDEVGDIVHEARVRARRGVDAVRKARPANLAREWASFVRVKNGQSRAAA